jgi:hypothetical protein
MHDVKALIAKSDKLAAQARKEAREWLGRNEIEQRL